MKNRNFAIFATAVLLAAQTCLSAADTTPILNHAETVAGPRVKAVDGGNAALSPERLKELKESLAGDLRLGTLSAEELNILRNRTRMMFGPSKKFEELSKGELLKLLDRDSIPPSGVEVESAPNRVNRPAGPPGGRPGSGDDLDPRSDRDRRGRAPSGPPGFVRRGGNPGGTARPMQPFPPTPYPDSGAFSAPFFQGIFEEEGNTDPEAAIRAYRTMIGRYDRQRRNVSIAIFRLGEIYRKAGDAENARKQYGRILKEFTDQDDLREQTEKALAELSKKP